MNSVKIIVAAVILMAASNLLSACSPQVSNVAIERVEEGNQLKKTVTLELEQKAIPGKKVLQIVLDNPEAESLTSAEVWLSYNPEHLKGLSLEPNNEFFELSAPYENNFDNAAGLMKLGRSSAEPVTEKKIILAEIEFEKLTNGIAMIEAYDYKHDLSGHSSVNMMNELEPVNVLLKPTTPLYILQK